MKAKTKIGVVVLVSFLAHQQSTKFVILSIYIGGRGPKIGTEYCEYAN